MTFIDLFAGIGGFRRGMELAGHKCVGFCEFDKFATASYTSMHLLSDEQRDYLETLDLKKRQKEILKDEYRNGEWYANDIRNVHAGNVPKCDCWCFGAPCQSFSIAGKREGFDGASGLIREVFRILKEIRQEDRPEWLIYENVKGMLSSNRGFDFLAILLEMDELGYDLEWFTFNSKYHGVPQNRERVYTVGHLRARGAAKIFPIKGTSGEDNICGIDIIGHRDGYRRNTQVFSENGVTEALDTATGGGRGHHVAIPIGNTNPSGHGMNGNIFDSKGVSPTVTTNKGEGNKIAIPVEFSKSDGIGKEIETAHCLSSTDWRGLNRNQSQNAVAIPISADNISSESGFNQINVVHSVNGVSRALIGGGGSGGYHDGNQPKVAIPVLTPDRAEKRQNGRRFKENGDEMFTLTAQDRHGVALEVKQIGKRTDTDRDNPQRNRVYDVKGVSPSLNGLGKGGNLEPQIPIGILRNVRSECGKEIRKQYESGEINISRHEFLEKEIRQDGVSNTVDSVQKDNLLAVGVENNQEADHAGIYVQLSEDCTVYAVWYEKYGCYIAIRKLTPRECFRLQGWTDDYFEKAQFVNSDSQLYKQAGNGVTVNVVYEIGKAIAESEGK